MPPVAANDRRLQLSVVLFDSRTSKVHPLSRVFTTARYCSLLCSFAYESVHHLVRYDYSEC